MDMDSILKTFAARDVFFHHLEKDIVENSRLLEETKQELDELQELTENIKTLGIYPEHSAIIPLAKNVYMKGRIIHTGEYYIKNTAFPDSYVVLKSLEQTVNMLNNKIKLKEDNIEKAEYANFQLEERIKILKGEDTVLAEADDLPKEIVSDKGVAVKVGEFYEILEYEEK